MKLISCVTKSSLKPYLLSYYITQQRWYARSFILGIETSCDDTACAIINKEGKVIAETLKSQQVIHLRNGGVVPDFARDLHRDYIDSVVQETLKKSKLQMNDVSAIAITTGPGLALCLYVGMKYAKYLARKFNKPLIPIHHMEAHALVARMNYDITFPYLTLLISGGHCLLVVVRDFNKFSLLGQSLNIAPGDLFDKIARRMKLRNLPEYSKVSGGEAIEKAALNAKNPQLFNIMFPLLQHRDCNFSFTCIKSSVMKFLNEKENEHKINSDFLIPEVYDLCAAVLNVTTKHLMLRTQRAMEFCEMFDLIKNRKQLIVSGGVACNNYIFNALKNMCNQYDYEIYRPPPKLCTDNGVMVAWNGLEKWRRNVDVINDFSGIDIKPTKKNLSESPLGESLISEVLKANIKVKRFKVKVNDIKTYLNLTNITLS